MTCRDRREAKAERLRGWAAQRETSAAAVFAANEPFTSDYAFNTQPGHFPLRSRVIASEDRAYESLSKARDMSARADSIEAQAAHAIYSDDPDAIEALQARIAKLATQRDQIKAENAAYRKEHSAELKALTAYGRDQALPHPSWELTNLTADIARNKKRVMQLVRVAEAS